MTIKRIDGRSLSRVLGVMYAILGFIGGAIFALAAIAGSIGAMAGWGGFGPLFGVGAIVVFPILYGLIGWIAGWIVAWLYNWVAGRFGGIVLETQ